jgi:P27 family predicted phage terminase small subunit
MLRPQLVAAPTRRPPAPDHLDKPEQKIWKHVLDDYGLANIAIDVLVSALEAHQRSRQCREVIDRDGMTVVGRDNQVKPHPLLSAERDARGQWLAAIKALGLDQEARDAPPRPWHDAS